jgi:hypothetical protein
MLSLAHTLISLPFGIFLDNPVLIFFAAFFGHFLCDTLLHWNIYPQNFKRYPVLLVALDILSGLVVAYVVLGSAFLSLPVLAAIAGGNMPDILHGFWEMLSPRQKKAFPSLLRTGFIWHEKVQLETHHVAPGLISQVVLVAVSLYLVSQF